MWCGWCVDVGVRVCGYAMRRCNLQVLQNCYNCYRCYMICHLVGICQMGVTEIQHILYHNSPRYVTVTAFFSKCVYLTHIYIKYIIVGATRVTVTLV